MTIVFRNRSTTLLAAALCFATLASVGSAKSSDIPKPIAAAVADPARPQADRDRDADRKPAECIAFAGLKPGDHIALIGNTLLERSQFFGQVEALLGLLQVVLL